MIEAKKEGQVVVETPEPHVAPVIDIMEALKRSLAEKKKPVQAATAAAGEAQEETASEPVTKKRARSKAV
jgi:non-homologous end joining protein Ku